MTPEDRKTIRDALIAVDRYFQKETGADVPSQYGLWDDLFETWKAAERAKRIMDREAA